MISIVAKRVYEAANPQDGYRVLVDRVWPRGMKKEQVGAELWMKDAAPSTALRQWFGHDRARWAEFKTRYFAELDGQTEAIDFLTRLVKEKPIVLLYSAHDTECNQAVALREYLLKRLGVV